MAQNSANTAAQHAIEVVAAVFRKDNTVLCLRRASGAHAGEWEFPGGKVEAGESLRDALIREINEELSVNIVTGEYLGENLHVTTPGVTEETLSRPVTAIRLHAFMVDEWSGQMVLSDHDRHQWSGATELHDLNWSAADIPFVNMLQSKLLAP